MNADRAAFVIEARAKFGESQFRVVARAHRFRYRSHAVREQSGEKDGGLHLRAWHGQRVVDGRETRAVNLQRREASFARVNPRAHLRERVHHAAHRPAAQGSVALEGRPEFLSCQNPGEQAHRRARISGVQRAARSAQSVEAEAGDADAVALNIDFHAELRETIERAAAIGRGGKVRDLACTLGERREHCVTMRNGFVAGNFERAADRAGRTNDLFGHARILARG